MRHRSRLPRNGVIKLRNDPGTIAMQLLYTIAGLLAVVVVMVAIVYTNVERFDADIDRDTAFGSANEPAAVAGDGRDAPGTPGTEAPAVLPEVADLGNMTAP